MLFLSFSWSGSTLMWMQEDTILAFFFYHSSAEGNTTHCLWSPLRCSLSGSWHIRAESNWTAGNSMQPFFFLWLGQCVGTGNQKPVSHTLKSPTRPLSFREGVGSAFKSNKISHYESLCKHHNKKAKLWPELWSYFSSAFLTNFAISH